jgi:hypothetical protein
VSHRRTLFGRGSRVVPQSRVTVQAIDPAAGFVSDVAPTDLEPGQTPFCSNFLMVDDGLEPRPGLSPLGASPNPLGTAVTGGMEVSNITGQTLPLISGTTRTAWFDGTSWSVNSYTSSHGIDDPPAGSATQYWDMTQIYDADTDQQLAVMANGSYQTLYCWEAGETVFSSMTDAPRAKYVAAFDNFLLAFNIVDTSGITAPQRVVWNDRGSNYTWTPGNNLAGFADLLDMRGQGTRIVADEAQLTLFSDEEVWNGQRAEFPFTFRFFPRDKTKGCPYPWSVVNSASGIIFVASDFHPYLLPRGGGPAVRIGQSVRPFLRDVVDAPTLMWASWHEEESQYMLFYPQQGGTGLPTRAVFLNTETGAWAPQRFDDATTGMSLSRGFPGRVQSGTTTWAEMTTAGVTWAQLTQTWAQLSGTDTPVRTVLCGSSAGTVYQLSSTASTDDGTEFTTKWRSGSLAGDMPQHHKTLNRVRVNYQGTSASTLTVRASADQGASFPSASAVPLTQVAGQVMAGVADVYVNGNYPVFEVEGVGGGYRITGFQAEMRVDGAQ